MTFACIIHIIHEGFFKSDSSLKEAFMSVSNTLREDFRFGYSTEEEVLEEYGYEE